MVIEHIVQPRINKGASPVALLTEDFNRGCANGGTSLWPCKAVMVVRHMSVASIVSLNKQEILRKLRLPLTTAGSRVAHHAPKIPIKMCI
jgi:hypothetical protein